MVWIATKFQYVSDINYNILFENSHPIAYKTFMGKIRNIIVLSIIVIVVYIMYILYILWFAITQRLLGNVLEILIYKKALNKIVWKHTKIYIPSLRKYVDPRMDNCIIINSEFKYWVKSKFFSRTVI